MVSDPTSRPADKPAPPPVSPRQFSTDALPPSDQFDAWRDHYRDVFDLNLAEPSRKAYPAEHVSWDLGGLTFTRASMPVGVERRWKHWSRPRIDDWILVAARRDKAHPGGPHVGFRSLYREFEGLGGDGEILTLFLPRDHFDKDAATFDGAPEQIPWNGMAAILADFLISLDQNLPSFSQGHIDGIASATKSLVTACISPTPEKLVQARDVLTRASFSRAQRIIRQHLYSPALGPEFLAQAAGLSRSTLYRVFASHGGVSSLITRERLNEAHRRLTSAGGPSAINALAYDLCFSDPSTFSRAFKRQFGYSPRDAISLRR
ncbi:AraC family transcriptional regulator [Chelatococcus asaccharovorans]|nr:AraC family transcriptional regulator [Chelatococcus asaccharovorans]CAH1675563.1 AraC family transcriptional regulator [Chelatococcus asaccharovorans]